MAKAHLCMSFDLMDLLNATVNMRTTQNSRDFDPTANVTDGHLAEVVAGQLDFSATGTMMHIDRVHLLDYALAPVKTFEYFYFRTPSLSYTDNLFVLPFDQRVWASFLALIALMVVLLTAIMWLEWHVPLLEADNGATNPDLLRTSVFDSFVLIFGATCQQGSSVTPRSNTARLFVIVAFIALMFLYTSYSANIVALLQSPSSKIQTLHDLLDSQLELGLDNSSYAAAYFAVSIFLLFLISFLVSN